MDTYGEEQPGFKSDDVDELLKVLDLEDFPDDGEPATTTEPVKTAIAPSIAPVVEAATPAESIFRIPEDAARRAWAHAEGDASGYGLEYRPALARSAGVVPIEAPAVSPVEVRDTPAVEAPAAKQPRTKPAADNRTVTLHVSGWTARQSNSKRKPDWIKLWLDDINIDRLSLASIGALAIISRLAAEAGTDGRVTTTRRKLASELGVRENNLHKQVLQPLVDAGYITLD